MRDVMQHYTLLWELIFCLIHSVQMPENTLHSDADLDFHHFYLIFHHLCCFYDQLPP